MAGSGQADERATPGEPHPAPAGSAKLLAIVREFEQAGQVWFWSTDGEGRIDHLSESIAARLGKPLDALLGQSLYQVFQIDRDREDGSERSLPLMLSTHKAFNGLVVRAVDGEVEGWWSITGRPQLSPEGAFLGYFGHGADVTESRMKERADSRLMQCDSLTGLLNRHRIGQRLEATLTAGRAAKRSCAVMMLDLDHFKEVNDTLGHPAGDELLRQVAERIGRVAEKGWEIGRLGGDEFQLILPDVDDRGRLGDFAKKIIAIVSQPYAIGDSRCMIGASVGVAVAPYDGIEPDEIVGAADLALYAAKGGGRGQFRFYSAELQDQEERRRKLELDLREALSRGQMGLVYQPIIETGTNKVVAMEAQLRWEHPDYGEVQPSVFLPLVERDNLMAGLSDWALRQACEDAVLWPGGVRVAVNVPTALFADAAFPAKVTQALACSELQPERLELELAEDVLTRQDSCLPEVFNALRILGVRMVIDHFGKGGAPLHCLANAPVDKIKIDRAFVRGGAMADARNAAIFKTLVAMAQELGFETGVDAIEAMDELERVRGLGAGQVQGNVYARPLTVEEAMDGMASGEWIIAPEGPSRFRDERRTVFRRVGLIHEDYRYEVMMRNLSRTGCLVEGLMMVPVGTQFVVDFAEGQLAVATVRRTVGSMLGLEFEMPLVDDGAGGLVTRNRVSPYILASAGMPLGALPRGNYPLSMAGGGNSGGFVTPKFAQVDETQRKTASAA